MSRRPTQRRNLSALLRLYRGVNEIPLRDLGREIGVSAATLLRIEQGRGMDDVTFMKLLAWLMRPDGRD